MPVPPDIPHFNVEAGIPTAEVCRRLREEKTVSVDLEHLFHIQMQRGQADEVSLAGLDLRWRYLANLPTPEPNNPIAPEVEAAVSEMERKRESADVSLG